MLARKRHKKKGYQERDNYINAGFDSNGEPWTTRRVQTEMEMKEKNHSKRRWRTAMRSCVYRWLYLCECLCIVGGWLCLCISTGEFLCIRMFVSIFTGMRAGMRVCRCARELLHWCALVSHQIHWEQKHRASAVTTSVVICAAVKSFVSTYSSTEKNQI